MTTTAPPATQPIQPLDLDALAAAALRRVVSQINRSAGQHLRALRKTDQLPQNPPAQA